MKLPYIDLYIGDWLKDSVSGCSLAAQGLWMRLLFIMQESEKRGYLLKLNPSKASKQLEPLLEESLARRVGCSLEEYRTLMRELTEAGVPSVTDGGVIYSRRMVRDEEKRLERSESGRKGGLARVKNSLSKTSSSPQANSDDEGEDEDGTDDSEKSLRTRMASLAGLIGCWFGRRPTTVWSLPEKKKLREIAKSDPTEEELALLNAYYTTEAKTFRRLDVITLLNNWNGEIDRARAWKANPDLGQERTYTTPVQRKTALEELIRDHACNKESTKFNPSSTAEQRAEYRKFQDDLQTVKKIVAAGGSK